MAGLGLVHSLYRAHRAVVPATVWHLVGFATGRAFGRTVKTYSKLLEMMEYISKYYVHANSFSLSCEHTQDNDDW